MPLPSTKENSAKIPMYITPVQNIGSDVATATATIAAAGSLSGAVDLLENQLHAVVIPAGWTAAAVSFQVSLDNVTWVDLYNSAGEVSITSANAVAGRAIVVDSGVFSGFRYLKIRSGVAATPVAQVAERVLGLSLRVR